MFCDTAKICLTNQFTCNIDEMTTTPFFQEAPFSMQGKLHRCIIMHEFKSL